MLEKLNFLQLTLLGAAYFGVRTAFLVTLGWLVALKTNYGRKYAIYKIPFLPEQFRSELFATAKVVLVDSIVLAAFFKLQLVHFADFSWTNYWIGLSALYLWFELWFYWTHRFMHHPKLFWIHRQHHVAKVTHPLTAMSFSVTERLILLFGILSFTFVASKFSNFCFESLITYSLLNLGLNILGHMNIEIYPPWYAKSILSRFLSFPTFHAIHHARMKGHYGLFSTLTDEVFGTAFPDYVAMQEQAAKGVGFDRLQAKLPSQSTKFVQNHESRL